MPTLHPLPYGTLDLDPQPHLVPGTPQHVRCYVRGCKELLELGLKSDGCPAHGIRCHFSRGKATYSYVEVRRNIIIDADLMATRIVGHPFKYDSKWLGNENSEDALTWNVFRSLQQARCLAQVAHSITGLDVKEEPRLYLWGICLGGDTFEPWDLLIAARKRFESNLPVKRPLTEPDIAMYLPGHYLILIEAKFTSPNPSYIDGPRQDGNSLTKNELLDIYYDPALQILDVEKAREAERVYYQLWRNMIFAEWMALADGKGTQAYHASLTRDGKEIESCEHFKGLMKSEFAGRFVHLPWEDMRLRNPNLPELQLLREYFETKTTGLLKGFCISTDHSPPHTLGQRTC